MTQPTGPDAMDTTNTDDKSATGTEREAAEYVAEKLSEVGYDVTYVESGAPGRGNVIARLPGTTSTRGAPLLHGHLDVVPADASEWSVYPFSGEVKDGYVWGRGAVDMKGALAMTLAVARAYERDGVMPARDLIFASLADEEAGGFAGARWLVETAEKGALWLRLKVSGTAGHGSMLHTDNDVAKLVGAITRLEQHRFPPIGRLQGERRPLTGDGYRGRADAARP